MHGGLDDGDILVAQDDEDHLAGLIVGVDELSQRAENGRRLDIGIVNGFEHPLAVDGRRAVDTLGEKLRHQRRNHFRVAGDVHEQLHGTILLA